MKLPSLRKRCPQFVGRTAEFQEIMRLADRMGKLFETCTYFGKDPTGDLGIRSSIDAKAAIIRNWQRQPPRD